MPFFTVVRPAALLSVGNDVLTVTAAASKPLNVWSVDVNGLGTSSAVGELKMTRSTGGTGSPTSIVPAKVDATSAAASFNARYGWSSQPSLTADSDLWLFAVNGNGGKDRFPGYPQPIPVPAGGQVSLRVLQGSHNVDQVWLIEEIG
jgi:hypothetical protein